MEQINLVNKRDWSLIVGGGGGWSVDFGYVTINLPDTLICLVAY